MVQRPLHVVLGPRSNIGDQFALVPRQETNLRVGHVGICAIAVVGVIVGPLEMGDPTVYAGAGTASIHTHFGMGGHVRRPVEGQRLLGVAEVSVQAQLQSADVSKEAPGKLPVRQLPVRSPRLEGLPH